MTASSLFIGRQSELETADRVLKRAAEGKGRIVFIEGGVGMGKGSFLDELEDREAMTKSDQKMPFVTTVCDAVSGERTAYQPFIEIIDELYRINRANRGNKEKTKEILSIIEELGPDWLKLIPGIGDALSVGLKSVTRIKNHLLGADDDTMANFSENLAKQYVDMLLKIGSQYERLCLVIRGVQWIDEVSCKLLFKLAHHPHTIDNAFQPL